MPASADSAGRPRFHPPNGESGDGVHHERCFSCSSLPERAFRLADNFRPRSTRSQLIRRSDGRYNEPYAAIVEADDAVSVLCVQRTQQQVLVRHMPEHEWHRIVRESEKVHPGVEGETSLHIVAPPEMSTLPVGAAEAAEEPCSAEQQVSPETGAVEPPVFDYFVAPENRIEKLKERRKKLLFSHINTRARCPRKELERVAREDRRAMLSVERRDIFLRQYQRDMQHRMEGTPLYTMGRELPEEFVQLFFMSERHDGVAGHRRARSGAAGAPDAQRSVQRSAGGRYLFTIDRSSNCFGERMPFAGQAPTDGFVVVTVGPTADAFSSAWRPWDGMRRPSDTEEEETPFVPYDYGSAEYLPRKSHDGSRDASEGAEGGEAAGRVMRVAETVCNATKQLGLASLLVTSAATENEKPMSDKESRASSKSSPLCLHPHHPLHRRFEARNRTTSRNKSGAATDDHSCRTHAHTSMPLPLSSEDESDECTEEKAPAPDAPCVIVKCDSSKEYVGGLQPCAVGTLSRPHLRKTSGIGASSSDAQPPARIGCRRSP
ncbi:hypothetical protein GH5_01552 [Leishmania sp. Ghana 2012 LV757]|uniref:hypothetical protein n=1 Tax=Leishmania sp. Ghana 2012 LV757 TaxID=2803181 RepID=UPI001B3FEB7A|nr:hypothetical protein GH5_01552 [Leishmania sp. Ghana 2012 LV757]